MLVEGSIMLYVLVCRGERQKYSWWLPTKKCMHSCMDDGKGKNKKRMYEAANQN